MKPTALRKHDEFSQEEIAEIKKHPGKIRNGKAIIGHVEHRYPDKTTERWLYLEDGTEIMEHTNAAGETSTITDMQDPGEKMLALKTKRINDAQAIENIPEIGEKV